MTSGSWCKGILLTAVLSCLLHHAIADCQDEGESCDQCYQTLSSFLVNTSNNKYQLEKTFFPPEKTSPVFVTVTYHYSSTSIPSQTWYWSAGLFYFYQPLRVFQFTSLLFGPPDLLRSAVTITLPAQCANAPEDFLQQLTQTLKLYATWKNANLRIDDTYVAKATNQGTLHRSYYHDPYSDKNIPALLYCFQMLFPFLTAVLMIEYTVCSVCSGSLKNYVRKHSEDDNSWATTTAYAFLCIEFVFYVIALDITAMCFRDYVDTETIPYHKEDYDRNLFYYPGVIFLYDIGGLLLWLLAASFISKFWCKLCKCKESDVYGMSEGVFLLCTLAGVAPLLCLASHAHYILIAWLSDPIHASSIGVYYGITIFMQFFALKQTYKHVSSYLDDRTNCNTICNTICKAIIKLVLMIMASFTIGAYQALFAVFFVIIPINHSIRDAPNAVYTIWQSISALLLALIAYKVILDPQRSFSISSGIQIALQKIKKWRDKKPEREREALDDEERFADVLYEILKDKVKLKGTSTKDVDKGRARGASAPPVLEVRPII